MKIVFILLITVFACAVFCDDSEISKEHQKAWEKFKIKHNRVFKNATREALRLKKFSDRLKKIESHNADSSSHKIALNKFADIPKSEFNRGHKGYIAPVESDNSENPDESPRVKRAPTKTPRTTTTTTTTTPRPPVIPASFDWRDYGAISSVKDQGGCGSCWTFSASGALEAQIFIRKNKSVDLSQQNLLDCTPNTKGCGGGGNKAAYYYIQANGGIDAALAYPYEGSQGTCRFNSNTVAGTSKGFTQSLPGDEEALKKAVFLNGPHSVAIDADHDSFQLYASGIYYEPNCSTVVLDHAVLLVGYGTDADKNDYWILKNSWGTDWGLNGYFHLARNKNNHCGITTYATCPLV